MRNVLTLRGQVKQPDDPTTIRLMNKGLYYKSQRILGYEDIPTGPKFWRTYPYPWGRYACLLMTIYNGFKLIGKMRMTKEEYADYFARADLQRCFDISTGLMASEWVKDLSGGEATLKVKTILPTDELWNLGRFHFAKLKAAYVVNTTSISNTNCSLMRGYSFGGGGADDTWGFECADVVPDSGSSWPHFVLLLARQLSDYLVYDPFLASWMSKSRWEYPGKDYIPVFKVPLNDVIETYIVDYDSPRSSLKSNFTDVTLNNLRDSLLIEFPGVTQITTVFADVDFKAGAKANYYNIQDTKQLGNLEYTLGWLLIVYFYSTGADKIAMQNLLVDLGVNPDEKLAGVKNPFRVFDRL